MSIQARGSGGKYLVRVYVPAPGREFRRVVKGKAAARKLEAQIRAEVARGGNPQAGTTHFGDYARMVVAARPLAPRTRQLYDRAITNHLDPTIGNARIDRITHTQLQQIVTNAPGTGKGVRRVLVLVFTAAMRDGIISRNPADGLVVTPAPPRQVVLPTWEQIRNADRWIQVMAGTGLRAGEAMGLSIDDLDVAARTITVRRQRLYTASIGGWHFGPPKTATSARTIPLTDYLVDVLQSLPTTPVTLSWRDEPTQTQTHHVWMTFDVSPWVRHRIGVGAHLLRHLYSTTLVNSGRVPITTIDQVMGHSGTDRPLSVGVYGHAHSSGGDRVRDVIAAALTGEEPGRA